MFPNDASNLATPGLGGASARDGRRDLPELTVTVENTTGWHAVGATRTDVVRRR